MVLSHLQPGARFKTRLLFGQRFHKHLATRRGERSERLERGICRFIADTPRMKYGKQSGDTLSWQQRLSFTRDASLVLECERGHDPRVSVG